MDQPTKCAICNEPFESKWYPRGGHWSRTCSRACSRKLSKEVERWQVREANGRCEHCGQPFYSPAKNAPSQVASGRGRFCSQACFIAETRPNRQADRRRERRRRKAIDAINSAAVGTSGRRAMVAGRCAECGQAFIDSRLTGGPNTARFCSIRCNRRASSARRRARTVAQRDGIIRRWYVLERDNFVCQLCGKKTLRSKAETLGTSNPHPLAPVLDHIVPLAHHGAHAEHNLQCAHYLCNSLKADTTGPLGDQLRLIA